MWKPLRFDLYLLQEIVGTFFGASLFIIFILIMFQALRLAEFFIIHGASALLLGKLTLFMGLSFLPSALPLAFLLTVLIGFGRLSSDSELIAMKANGISLTRLSVPIFFFALIVSGVCVGLNNHWVPWGETAFKKTQIKMGNTKAVSAIKEGTFTSGFFDLLIFADHVDTKTNRMHHVFIYDEREPKNPLTYVSQDAEIIPVRTSTELGAAILLRLYNGSMHHDNKETQTYEKMNFDTYHLYLKIDEGSDTTILKPHMILEDDLIEKIKTSSLDTHAGREYRAEYWRRYAMALSPVIFVLLGIGFGTFRNRTARTGAVLTVFFIILVYWSLQTAGTDAVERGLIQPWLAMQIPNFLFLILGGIAFRRASW
jgi:lipopolysaccharide export system permease protein